MIQIQTWFNINKTIFRKGSSIFKWYSQACPWEWDSIKITIPKKIPMGILYFKNKLISKSIKSTPSCFSTYSNTQSNKHCSSGLQIMLVQNSEVLLNLSSAPWSQVRSKIVATHYFCIEVCKFILDGRGVICR